MKWLAWACVILPIVALIVIYAFGIRNQLVVWLAILLCPIMHIAMHYLKPEAKCH